MCGMNRCLSVLPLLGAVVFLLTGCSSLRVRVSGDKGVQYQAAWTTEAQGNVTRSGPVPATFKFPADVVGWFRNAGASGEFRVRVYEGMGVLVDETVVDSGRRVVIERKGKGVSFRIE